MYQKEKKSIFSIHICDHLSDHENHSKRATNLSDYLHILPNQRMNSDKQLNTILLNNNSLEIKIKDSQLTI